MTSAIGASFDIEERLRFAERLLGVDHGLMALSHDARYLYWNAAMESMTGLVAAQVLGKIADDVYPLLVGEQKLDPLTMILAGTPKVVTSGVYSIRDTGQMGRFEAEYLPLDAPQGEIVGIMGVVRDTTAQRAADVQLYETEARFRNMANASPVLLWMSGPDSLCTFFNQTWLDFTGRTLEEEWGVGWAEGVHFEDFQRCVDTYETAFGERRPFEMEYRLRRKDGEYRWVLDRATPRYGPHGEFAGFIGSCVDITDLKRVESNLRRALRDRDDFLSIASHELRTPITVLQLQLDSLQRTLRERPDEGMSSGRIEKNVLSSATQTTRLARLVDELLDVSRIAAGNLELSLEEFDLTALTKEVCERLASTIKAAGCNLICDLDHAVSGQWDKRHIDRVLVNLLSNASKYGRGAPIRISVAQVGSRARILVVDRGIGIAPENHGRIFERFERAASPSHYGGFGLGLWIARETVRAHGGTIRVSSVLGSGAEFHRGIARRTSLRATSFMKSPLSWIVLALVALLSVSVFWLFDALPFQDLPAHAGEIALRAAFAHSSFYQHYFVLAPRLGPYSLFRFLGSAFATFLGPVGAVRALATLPVLATPGALFFARARLHGDTSLDAAYLGFALSFGLMTLFGFASFELAVAILLFVFTLWLVILADADAGTPTWRRELVFAPLALLVFFAHGHAFILLSMLAGISAIASERTSRVRRLVRLRAFVPAFAFAAFSAWNERASHIPRGSAPVRTAPFALHFHGLLDKLSILLSPTLMTRTGIDIVAGVAIWAIVGVAVARSIRALREPATDSHDLRSRAHSRALFACAAFLFAAFALLPHSIGWFGFVDGRIVPLILFLGIMGIQRPALSARFACLLRRAAPICAVIIASLALVASGVFQNEARGYRDILQTVPAEARLLNLPLDPNSDVFALHPFIHYDKLLMVDRPVLLSDVWFLMGPGVYPTYEDPVLRLPLSYSGSDLRVIEWSAYTWSDWDYVLIRTRPGAHAPDAPKPLSLAKHRGGWWLYHVVLQ